eukprot:1259709-Rhodomonas_salina.1
MVPFIAIGAIYGGKSAISGGSCAIPGLSFLRFWRNSRHLWHLCARQACCRSRLWYCLSGTHL